MLLAVHSNFGVVLVSHAHPVHCMLHWLLQVWKLPSLVLSLKLSGHKRGVWAAAFSPVEQAIATSSADRTIKLWSLKDGTCLRTFQGHTASALRLLYLSSGMQVPVSSRTFSLGINYVQL